MDRTYGGLNMFGDMRSFIFIIAAFVCGAIGGFLASKAKKNNKAAFLVASLVFALLCLIGIIAAVISLVMSKI